MKTASAPDNRRRAYWLKTLHEWHWVSSALCLIGMILFAVTGFTLNHASQIESKPRITTLRASVDAAQRERLAQQAGEIVKTRKGRAELPTELQAWAKKNWQLDTPGEAEWSEAEIYLSLPRPGGDAWMRLNLDDGEVEYERTDRGWISYLNDLHKGRHTGVAWSWFIDVFAGAALVFSITGLFILKMHAGNRPFTWPMVGMGLVIPVLLALLFIH
ncbi:MULTISPECIES: PepSY-associated TM helix domain-containing protein [unclassified Variovorax]|uniref:PepSY-associated TM helix domain-containing protein n=1 Tax=unclassified Variovorax TaxID=663243 RepID=UPI0025772CE9|nr:MULTISPECIES: PepSY-associated TM helix domain-containing protein [unclassified Variovorax]MDM0091788.1 PepSY-associated TM helix domain-containing protein [Variovorax sp. J22G40]MDM0147710.1 PepSY-associated TM helix domain-containing protein [Variovorax sp. J2P1-31]